jgi:glutamine amidotransferase-like uncharacterized protein
MGKKTGRDQDKDFKIVLFSDEKTSTLELSKSLSESFNSVAVRPVHAPELKKDTSLFNDRTLAFVLPGIIGEECPYPRQIAPEERRKIRDYVENGGVFIGFCAGAYHACREIVYDAPWLASQKKYRPGSPLFNAVAKGPIPRPVPSKGMGLMAQPIIYETPDGNMRRTKVAYDFGPALIPDENEDQHLEIIARYDGVPGNPVAIAARKVGKGLAIFVGVLPYLQSVSVPGNRGFDELRKVMDELASNEPGRQEVWDLIVSRIRAHHQTLGKVPASLLQNTP